MQLPMFQVDAFADRPFTGNPAAICPLEKWLDRDVMQAIAAENNLSETAFFVAKPGEGPGVYDLRWFTPASEVDLCGHATLASAYVLFTELGLTADMVHFDTASGRLSVARTDDGRLAMELPAWVPEAEPRGGAIAASLGAELGRLPASILRAPYLLAVYETEDDVRRLTLGRGLQQALEAADAWGLIATAPSGPNTDYDFVSRFFAPGKGVAEDPVTGSAHCALTPYWAERLGKRTLHAFQASRRGGHVGCLYDKAGGRVTLLGQCAPYLKGTICV